MCSCHWHRKLRLPKRGRPSLCWHVLPGEHHDLGLLALWVLLQERRLRLIYLGGDLPGAELVAACEAVKADAAVLVATTAGAVPGMSLTVDR